MKISCAGLSFVFLLAAAEMRSAPLEFERDATRHLNRFSWSGRFGFNISADFNDGSLPGFASAAPGPSTGGALDRFYDDGYVRQDASGNAGGTTWFWGYDHSAQVDLANDSLNFHGAISAATGPRSTRGVADDPQLGFELRYQRELALAGSVRWGLETAFGWTGLEITDHPSVITKVQWITDSYSLGGIVPPQAPYQGSFSGPGPLISDVPSRAVADRSIVSSGWREIDSDLYSFRLGLYAEIPLSPRCAVQLGAGLALVYLDSQFDFSQQIPASGGGLMSTRGRSTKTDWLPGAYAQAELAFTITDRITAFGGIQYQHSADFRQAVASHSVTLNLGEAIFGLAGVAFSF